MRRKNSPTDVGQDWFLREWMAVQGVRQADIVERTGWSKGTVSLMVNGRTNYYRDIVNVLADALGIEPFELLMDPADAIALRQLRSSAHAIVEIQAAEPRRAWAGPPPLLDLTGTDG